MAETKGWSPGESQPASAKAARKPQTQVKSHPVPPCAFKGCEFCHGGGHVHEDAEEPHACTYPSQPALGASEILQHLTMVPRLVPSCNTARVHRFFADWHILDPLLTEGGGRIASFHSSSLGELNKLHQVEGFHMLPRRIFASYSAYNMQRGFAVNLETPRPGAEPGKPTQFQPWAAANCSVGRETNGSTSNVGLVVREGTVQNELVYEMRLPPCDGPVHPLLALAALDLNKVERDIGSESALSLATNEKGDSVVVARSHEVVIAAAGSVDEAIIEVTKDRKDRAIEHIFTLRELAQKANYLMSIGESDLVSARPRITMHPIGPITATECDKLKKEAESMRCGAMRFSVEFTVVYNAIPSVHGAH